jgi:signal transduction histidine kinase
LAAADDQTRKQRSEAIVAALDADGQWSGEIATRKKDGSELWCWVSLSVLESAEHGALWAGTCSDVTQQKQAQQEAREEQRHLRQVLEMYERDRKFTAYEIHDGFVQQATAALMSFQAVAGSRAHDPAQADKTFQQGLGMLADGIAEARWLISGLRPSILDDFGVTAAIDHLVRENRVRSGRDIQWSHQVRFERLAAPLETAIFRIIQESLGNALRHSKSERIGITMVQDDAHVRVTVEDWGCGFDPRAVPKDRFGLEGICERARLLGGRANIDSRPGEGTRILVELPLVFAESGTSDTAKS